MNLYDAAAIGDLARVQVLVEQGADKEKSFGDWNETALIRAADKGHLDVVRYLAEQGADLDSAHECNFQWPH